MLAERTASAVVIFALCLGLVLSGGWIYAIGLAGILSIAAWEFATIAQKGGYAPAKIIFTACTFLYALSCQFDNFRVSLSVFSLSVLVNIIYHIVTYKDHRQTAALDLSISLAGMAFIAFMGGFLVRLRYLPDGLFWVILCILPAGISDVGAYFIGNAFGKHKIIPQLSPNKSWEGYFGGVFTAIVIGYGAGVVLSLYNPLFTGIKGLLIGLIAGMVCPLGDFAKSIYKRQFGLKNTGSLIPGHGGVLDRIDTWLWAGITSYFLITYFFM
jgi:phosphatidate cytidylyltransferase